MSTATATIAARKALTDTASNVELVVDDLFDSKLEPRSFDLVHARYEIAPLGRGRDQVASHQQSASRSQGSTHT